MASRIGRSASAFQFDGAVHLMPAPVSAASPLAAWSEEIVAMGRFTRNNGITEGFHNKMELINRQAYGFRNFQNYRPCVKVLCA